MTNCPLPGLIVGSSASDVWTFALHQRAASNTCKLERLRRNSVFQPFTGNLTQLCLSWGKTNGIQKTLFQYHQYFMFFQNLILNTCWISPVFHDSNSYILIFSNLIISLLQKSVYWNISRIADLSRILHQFAHIVHNLTSTERQKIPGRRKKTFTKNHGKIQHV